MRLDVARRSVRDARRMIVGFGIGVFAYSLLLAAFFPTIRAQSAGLQQLLDSYPPALKAAFGSDAIFTGVGYLRAELFSFTLPVLFLVFAIGRGSDAIAGEEGRGQLELPLSTPLTRSRLVLEKALGLAAGLAILGAILLVALDAANLAVALAIPFVNLAAAVASLVLLAACCGAVSLAAGAMRGRRGVAIAAGALVASLSYIFGVIAKISTGAAWLRWLSLFHYDDGNNPLLNGPDWGGMAVLAIVAVALVALGTFAFGRRDVGG